MSSNGLWTQALPDNKSMVQDSSPVAQRKDDKQEDKDRKEGNPERGPHSDNDFVQNPFYKLTRLTRSVNDENQK